MGEYKLIKEIINAKKDSKILLELLERFTPLIKKYAKILRYEDAYSDLQLDFIEIISKIDMDKMKRTEDYVLLNYIKKSVRNAYIKRLNAQYDYRTKNCLFSEMSDEQLAVVSGLLSTTDKHEVFNLIEYQYNLSKSEFEVIVKIYYYGYKVSDISREKNISRQAVNQVKIRALAKLYNQLMTIMS